MNEGRRIYYGWWLTIGLFIIGMLGPLGRYSVAAFIPFFSTELGWSRASIGLGQSISMWMYAFFVLLAGFLIDRFGSRKTFFVGGFLTAVGWILLSRIESLWGLYLSYGILMALPVSMTHLVPLQATARKWFSKKAGIVGGIMAAAFSVGSAIFMPVITGMAGSVGWRFTSLVCGIGFGVIIMSISFFVIRDTPESMGLHIDGTNSSSSFCSSDGSTISDISWQVSKVVRTLPLWLLLISYSMVGIPIQGTLASIIAWGVDTGSTATTAGLFMTAITVPSIVGKIGLGWCGDTYGKRRILFLAPVLGMLVMLYGWQYVSTPQTLIIFAVLTGITYGGPLALFAPFLGDVFGRANVGLLFGILTLGHGLIGGSGPLIWGKIYEIYGSYNVACLVCAVCYAIAAMCILFVRPLQPPK
jgi:MFS family permease